MVGRRTFVDSASGRRLGSFSPITSPWGEGQVEGECFRYQYVPSALPPTRVPPHLNPLPQRGEARAL